MPVRRGHVAPQNTYIDTLIKKFDSQSAKFIITNAAVPNKPIIYCSDGFCSIFDFTKGQLLLKSASLQILHGPETSELASQRLSGSLHSDTEAEIQLTLYKKSRQSVLIHVVIAPVRDETGNIPLYILFFREEGERYVEDLPDKATLESYNHSFIRKILNRFCLRQKIDQSLANSSISKPSLKSQTGSYNKYTPSRSRSRNTMSARHIVNKNCPTTKKIIRSDTLQEGTFNGDQSNIQSNQLLIPSDDIERASFPGEDEPLQSLNISQKPRGSIFNRAMGKRVSYMTVGGGPENSDPLQLNNPVALSQKKSLTQQSLGKKEQLARTSLEASEGSPLVANQLTAMIPLMSIQPHLHHILGANNDSSTFRLVLSTETDHKKSHVSEKFAQSALHLGPRNSFGSTLVNYGFQSSFVRD